MAYTKEELKLEPYFDMEVLLGLLQESRIGGKILEDLIEAWERWLPSLHGVEITLGDKSRYILVWLDASVEQEIDTTWTRSASEGFRLNSLAQAMCMGCVYQFLPEVETAGCAPAPRPSKGLEEALKDVGVPYISGGPGLSLRFAVLTHTPFRGACEICHLRQECPKAQGQSDSFHSVLLPGHDQ